MNAPFTNSDRRAGREAMEESLTPLVKALRRFAAGRKSEKDDTPIGAVMLLTEQRKRLLKALADEKVKGARVTHQAVVIRFTPPPRTDMLADTIPVEEGKESEAIQFLEQYGKKFKQKFVIAGVMFAVQHGQEKRPFAQLIEQTQEGQAALKYAWDRQLQRIPRRTMS